MHGPVYATASDLAEYLDASAPDNADQLLQRASRLVDGLLIGAVYKVDDQEQPTDQKVADALADATVAQAAYWHVNGEPHEGTTAYGSVSIGNVSLSRGQAPTTTTRDGRTVAPGVLDGLQVAGLLPIRPYLVG